MRIRQLYLPVLALSLLAAVPRETKACVTSPLPPPPATVIAKGANRYDVIVKSYLTFASNPGSQFCACALAHRGLVIISVDGVQIVDAVTGQDLGYGFSSNTQVTSGFNAVQGSSWGGFKGTSPGTAAGRVVNLVFAVTAVPNSSPQDVGGALAFVGTDESSSAGTLLGTHQNVFSLAGGQAPLFSTWGLILFALSLVGMLLWKELKGSAEPVPPLV